MKKVHPEGTDAQVRISGGDWAPIEEARATAHLHMEDADLEREQRTADYVRSLGQETQPTEREHRARIMKAQEIQRQLEDPNYAPPDLRSVQAETEAFRSHLQETQSESEYTRIINDEHAWEYHLGKWRSNEAKIRRQEELIRLGELEGHIKAHEDAKYAEHVAEQKAQEAAELQARVASGGGSTREAAEAAFARGERVIKLSPRQRSGLKPDTAPQIIAEEHDDS